MRRLFGAALAAGLAALGVFGGVGAADAHGAPPVRLRAMTYNIHAGAGEDGHFDLNRTAAEIRAQHADLIGLQEVDVHWSTRSDFVDEARALADKLDMHVFFAPIYDEPPATDGAPRRQFGVAVLSRYHIQHAVNHEITRLSTQVPNPVPTPAPGFAEVDVLVRGVPVHFYDTHLDYRGDPGVRRAQVADMRRIMSADHATKILVGDFNAGPDAPELAPLWTDLTDALAQTPNRDQLTYPAGTPKARDDYVTAEHGIDVESAYVPDGLVDGTQASDHRPVVADLAIPRTH